MEPSAAAFDLATVAATAAASSPASAPHALALLDLTSQLIRAHVRGSRDSPQAVLAGILLARGYDDLSETTLQRHAKPLPPPTGMLAAPPTADQRRIRQELAAARRLAGADPSVFPFSILRAVGRSIKTDGDWPFDGDESFFLPQAVWWQANGARLTAVSIKRDSFAALLQALRRLTALLGPRASIPNESLVIELKVATQQLGKLNFELGPVLEHLRLREPSFTAIASPPAGSAASLAASDGGRGRKDSGAGIETSKAATGAGAGAGSGGKLFNRLGALGAGLSKLASSVQQAANTALVQAKAELGQGQEEGNTNISTSGGVSGRGGEGASGTAVDGSTPLASSSSSSSSSIFGASSPVTATSSLSSAELVAYASLVAKVCDEADAFGRWVAAALDGAALRQALEMQAAATSSTVEEEEEKLASTFLTCGETRLAFSHCKTAASQWAALPTEVGIATKRITAFFSGSFLPLVLHDASVLLSRYLEKNGSGDSLFFKKLPSQQ